MVNNEFFDVQMTKSQESFFEIAWSGGSRSYFQTVVMVIRFDKYLQFQFQFVIISYSF